jgi:hypothetical protein
MIDLKQTYVTFETWGRFILPIRKVQVFTDIHRVELSFTDDGLEMYTLKDNKPSVMFSIVPHEVLAAAVAAKKMEG